MKKLFLLLFTIPLCALYNGNPAGPQMIEEGFLFSKEGWFGLKLGYQGDYIWDRKMKTTSKFTATFDDFEIWMDQGAIAVNILDRAEIYSTLGALKIKATERVATNLRDEYETGYRFTWGLGGRVLVYNFGDGSIGIDGKCQWADPGINAIDVSGVPLSNIGSAGIHYFEWQVGAGLSYQIDIFIPYFAVKYSNVSARFKNLPPTLSPNFSHFNAKNRHKFGLALGTALTTGRLFSLNVEVRIIDEQSLTLSGDLRF